jgi:hypothetical protein
VDAVLVAADHHPALTGARLKRLLSSGRSMRSHNRNANLAFASNHVGDYRFGLIFAPVYA